MSDKLPCCKHVEEGAPIAGYTKRKVALCVFCLDEYNSIEYQRPETDDE